MQRVNNILWPSASNTRHLFKILSVSKPPSPDDHHLFQGLGIVCCMQNDDREGRLLKSLGWETHVLKSGEGNSGWFRSLGWWWIGSAAVIAAGLGAWRHFDCGGGSGRRALWSGLVGSALWLFEIRNRDEQEKVVMIAHKPWVLEAEDELPVQMRTGGRVWYFIRYKHIASGVRFVLVYVGGNGHRDDILKQAKTMATMTTLSGTTTTLPILIDCGVVESGFQAVDPTKVIHVIGHKRVEEGIESIISLGHTSLTFF